MAFLQDLIFRLDPGSDRLARLAWLYACAAVPCLLLVLLVSEWPRADGLRDLSGATFGHDFSQVWVAGRTALAGPAAQVYDGPRHDLAQIATFGPGAALFAWHYPPVFLLPAAALAWLPYAAAVLGWGLMSLGLIIAALRGILGTWRGALVGLAFPTVADALAYGQNGLVTAGLLGLGLHLAEDRPWAAGALIGLVGYKPQLLVLVPLVMLLSGRWRVAAGSALSATAAAALSLACFGPEPWLAFLRGLSDVNADIFTQAWAGLALNASAFGAVRILGGQVASAWVVQIAVAATALGLTLAIWRRTPAAPLRNAALLAAIPLVSPYVPVYDLAVLVPAGAFLVVGVRAAGGLAPGERLAIPPLLALAFDPRGATNLIHLPVGFLLAAAVFALALRRAWQPASARSRLPIGGWRNIGPADARCAKSG